MKLIVSYELNGVFRVTVADEICRVRDGFWVDGSWELCYSQNARFFIMPHMITEIRKEEKQ